jgi:long-chain fatty acid transport protein
MNPKNLRFIGTRRARQRLSGSGAVGLFTTLAAGTATAEGLRNPPPGAYGLGRAGSRVAHVEDTSAITHNPANLTGLNGLDTTLSLMAVHIAVDYEGAGGTTAETVDPWKYLPAFYAATPLKDDRFAVGVGLHSPYGLSNEWDQNGAFRYTAPWFTELKTINLNPTFAWKINEQFSLGLGVDVMWSELRLKQLYPWALITGNPAAPEGELSAKGDGFGFGGNLGLTWQIAERHRLAATYRSQMTVDYDGDFSVSNFPGGFPVGAPGSSFGSSITFPDIVSVGYGFQVNDRVRVGADVEWLQFSNFKTLPIEVGAPPPLVPTSINQDWDDTFTFGIGGDWRINDAFTLRASYQYYMTPIPDETLSPTIPDSDQNVVTASVEYAWGRSRVELAYGLVLYNDRDITNNQNPAFNGHYEFAVHLFTAGYRFSF